MSMEYREHAPSGALASLVRCYWTVRGSPLPTAAIVNRIMPDGCMDVLFDLRAEKGASRVVGAMLQAEVFQYDHFVDSMGVRFVPGAAPLFLRARADEFTGLVEDASALWRDADDLINMLREATGQAERLRRLDGYLLRRLDRAKHTSTAMQGMAIIERAHGQIRIATLCQALNSSERSLQRLFAQQVGLTPKQAVRIMRFRNALQHMKRERHCNLARIALSCGYADQAHFTRDFHDLAAISPTTYMRERSLVGFVQDEAGTPRLDSQ